MAAIATISIHAACEGGDARGGTPGKVTVISIHAAREGGDLGDVVVILHIHISIHAAREGGDFDLAYPSDDYLVFQSTPPVRAATEKLLPRVRCVWDFNPRRL